MPPRRPPPGGFSTFAFGNADDLKKEKLGASVSDGLFSDVSTGISPAQIEVIRGLLATSADVNELVERMQSDLLGGGATGAEKGTRELNGSSRPRAAAVPSNKVKASQDAFRAALAHRGTDTLVRLGKKFFIMDDDHSHSLSYEEFKKGLREGGIKLEEQDLQALFRHFDTDCSGYISFDELLFGVRPDMSDSRKNLVLNVFKQMDINNDGALTVQDVSGRYDCSLHPEVVAGARTEVEVLQAFLAGFDGSMGSKSAVVTPEKFLAHYNNVSASVEDDEYFELMMRNCWHLQGSDLRCRRLLVTHEDGTQSIEEVDNDYDISKEDLQEIKAKLREQGVPVVKVALYGYVDQDAGNILSSTMSPKRGSPVPSRKPSASGGTEEPEKVAAAYKQRMSTSNVSFA
eukprot:jgi/Ulvmu1/12721/UM095_0025.1